MMKPPRHVLKEISKKEVKYWALHADLYEKVFIKLKNTSTIKSTAKALVKKISDKTRQLAVLYFANYRTNELSPGKMEGKVNEFQALKSKDHPVFNADKEDELRVGIKEVLKTSRLIENNTKNRIK